jgi:hypothetical protein
MLNFFSRIFSDYNNKGDDYNNNDITSGILICIIYPKSSTCNYRYLLVKEHDFDKFTWELITISRPFTTDNRTIKHKLTNFVIKLRLFLNKKKTHNAISCLQ